MAMGTTALSRRDVVRGLIRFMVAGCGVAGLSATTAPVAIAQIADSDFVLIQPGTFEMGDASIPNARVHTVTLTHSFLIQKTPLTQAQWMAVMGNNPSHFKE